MEPILWLLLPVAAFSGWVSANRARKIKQDGVQSRQSSQSGQQCIQGLNYLLSEQSDKAIQLLVDLVDVDDETIETHLVLGSLFRRRGEVDRAIHIHQNIIARPTLSPEQKNDAMQQLGIDYLKAGLLDRAENIFLQLVETSGNKTEVFRYLRNLYEQEKEWEKAIDFSVRLAHIGAEPQSSRIAHYYCELVEQQVARKNLDDAVRNNKQAVRHDPDCIRAYIQCGDLQRKSGDIKAAMKCFQAALKRDSYFSPIALKRLFDLFEEQNELNKFPAFLRKHANCENDAAARYFLVTAYIHLNNREKVDELLQNELTRKEASPYIIHSYLEKMRDATQGEIHSSFKALGRLLESRLSTNMSCHCTQCGFESNLIFWQCPGCRNWGTVRPYQNPLEYSWLKH